MIEVCRRTVLKGAAAVCGAGALSACGGGGDAPTAGTEDGPGGTLATLADVEVGKAVASEGPEGAKLLVVRTGEAEAVAYSAVCPHSGCTVAPDFACPCHGSRFDPATGERTAGPADSGLTPFPVRVVDGRVVPA